MLPVVDVTAGVRFALDVLSDPGPMVMPVPAYSPQLEIAQVTGRERVDLLLDPDAERAEIDLDHLDRLLADGARTLLLTQPHNPWGRVFTRAELEGIRDVVVRHGARVVTDEIHAPLVLPGAEHVSYLAIDGTADHAVAVVASSKAFNTAGLRCAQIVTARRGRPRAAPRRTDGRATTRGRRWASSPRWRRTPHGDAVAGRPRAAARRPAHPAGEPAGGPPARGADAAARGDVPGLARPAGLRPRRPGAVALERGRVRLFARHDYQPGLTGHVRLNFATSPAG